MQKTKRPKTKTQTKDKGGMFTKLLANCAGNPEDLEDQDWYLDSPDIRLTRIFSVVLVLHIIAIGGILAFKMIDKASSGDGDATALAKASSIPVEGSAEDKVIAAKAPQLTQNPLEQQQSDPESRSDQYKVIPGDTLPEIARKLGVSPAALRLANSISIDDDIYPGMWLDIPDSEKRVESDMIADYDQLPDHPVNIKSESPDDINSSSKTETKYIGPGSNSAIGDSGVVYKVQEGDTAWAISRKFGIHHTRLLEHNGIDRPESLRVGQMLSIPE